MTDDIDFSKLRSLVGSVIIQPKWYTHQAFEEACARLGIAIPPDLPVEGENIKRKRMERAVASVPNIDLPKIAEFILGDRQLPPLNIGVRNGIQDVLWAAQRTLEIPKRTRREIAQKLNLRDLSFNTEHFMNLLDSLWVLDNDPMDWLAESTSLRAQIERHVFRNPGDWTTEQLFDKLGAFEAGDVRFALFLEGLASADILHDDTAQQAVVKTVNPHLNAIGLELRETGVDGGYPVFTVISIHAAHNKRPINVIFAALDEKPDIRLASAVDNVIEVVSNKDKVLVYDLPTSTEGLKWRDLQEWWKNNHQIEDNNEAKKSLYYRLRSCLPDVNTSPPQRNLFEIYHEIYGTAIPNLPALLPEVWLHWDPKAVRERGAEALLRSRMDFLLLLPHNQRVVIEVDGQQHYSKDGRPDGGEYAKNMRADRDLKLRGYEVFRFGAIELQDRGAARNLLQTFFKDLFRRYSVHS